MSFIFRKVFSKNQDSKANQSALDMTQSMIDFITDDNLDGNDSFRTQQPYLDRSYDLTEENPKLFKHARSETEADFQMKKPRLNITSVLNTPKRVLIVLTSELIE